MADPDQPASSPAPRRVAAPRLVLEPAGPHALAAAVGDLTEDAALDRYTALIGGLLASALGRGAAALRVGGSDTAVEISMRTDGDWGTPLSLPAWTRIGLLFQLRRLTGLGAEAALGDLGGTVIQTRLAGRAIRFQIEELDPVQPPKVVLRCYDPNRAATVEQLGLDQDMLRRVRRWTAAREGLLLVVGPPDSGRSTTLLALARLVGKSRPTALVGEAALWDAPKVSSYVLGQTTGLDTEAAIDLCLEADADPDILVVDGLRDTAAARSASRHTARLA